jgi:hypothetical protein
MAPMYDFSFTISYTRGCSEYTDVFIEHESLRSEAIYACMDPAEMWVLESVTEDPGELAAAEDRLLDASLDRYSITDRPCEAEKRTNLLNTERRRRVTFTHVADASHCAAIPLIAAKYLSSGVVFKFCRGGLPFLKEQRSERSERVALTRTPFSFAHQKSKISEDAVGRGGADNPFYR